MPHSALTQPRPFTVPRVDTVLAGDRTGAGAPVLLLHGLTATRRYVLHGSTALARSGFELIGYDARGHGESESTATPEPYHWKELAGDQLALADTLGIGTYIAGGASMGCATALHAAVIAPERITGLVLMIPPTAWESRPAQWRSYEISAALVEAGDLDTLIAGSRSAPAPDPFARLPQWRDAMEQSVRTADLVRLARVFRGAALADLPSPDAIASIKVPVLIMAWTGDPGHPMSTAERLVELLPQAHLLVAKRFRDFAAWTPAVTEFLQRT